MAFDYQSAKKSGYTDEEISAYLKSSGRDFDVAGAKKSGYTDGEISSYLENSKPKHSEVGANVGQFVANLATIGQPKPIKVAAGTLGRVAGEGVQQSLDPRTSSVGDAAKIILGLLQGKKLSDRILSPEEQAGAMRKISKEQAGENLKNAGQEAAIGLGTELAGEYVLSPMLDKVFSKGKGVVKTAINPGKTFAESRNIAANAANEVKISGDVFENAINKEVEKMGTEDAAKAGERLISSVKGKTFSPAQLLDRLDFWNSAYSASGKVGKTEEARIMSALARAARDQLSETAPDVMKYQNYLALTHNVPKALRKALWYITLGKVATSLGE